MDRLHLTPWPQAKAYHEWQSLDDNARSWEEHPFTKDFLFRLKSLRDAQVADLVAGKRDKFGVDRSDEARAIIHFADTLLSYAPAIHKLMEQVQKGQEQIEARQVKGPIHGGDNLTNFSL